MKNMYTSKIGKYVATALLPVYIGCATLHSTIDKVYRQNTREQAEFSHNMSKKIEKIKEDIKDKIDERRVQIKEGLKEIENFCKEKRLTTGEFFDCMSMILANPDAFPDSNKSVTETIKSIYKSVKESEK